MKLVDGQNVTCSAAENNVLPNGHELGLLPSLCLVFFNRIQKFPPSESPGDPPILSPLCRALDRKRRGGGVPSLRSYISGGQEVL